MGLGDLVRQGITSVQGPGRLYRAAVRAGAGPDGAFEVLRVSHAATRVATQHGSGVPGRANAVRHFLWQALVTARVGAVTARAVAAAQEAGSQRRRDTEVDEHNNAVGQQYGAAHADELRAGPALDAARRLAPTALQKWDAGELIWLTRR
jgi:hypothetical protein